MVAPRAWEKDLELVVSIDPSLPRTVVGDVTRLRQVLVNLLGNAVKFTEEGRVWLRVEPEDDLVRFFVRDTGIGIDAEEAERLFDVFSQAEASTSRKFGGTGLGLAISKQLVECMGGSMVATGAKGTGAEFRFTARLVAAPGEASASIEPDPELQGLRIAAMMDEGPSRDALVELAAALGVDLRPVVGDDPAPGSTDVVLVDRRHDHGRGVARAVALGRELELPVVALTRALDRSGCEQAGADHCISKPLKASAFRRALQKIVRGTPAGASSAVRSVVSALETGVAAQTTVLVAEDDRVSQRVIGRMLERLGYGHLCVDDGQAALEAMETASFDVVLMDAREPRVDGLEATRHIRARSDWHQPYVVAMTADATDDGRREALEAGMDEFLGKPVTKDALRRVLGRVAPGATIQP